MYFKKGAKESSSLCLQAEVSGCCAKRRSATPSPGSAHAGPGVARWPWGHLPLWACPWWLPAQQRTRSLRQWCVRQLPQLSTGLCTHKVGVGVCGQGVAWKLVCWVGSWCWCPPAMVLESCSPCSQYGLCLQERPQSFIPEPGMLKWALQLTCL